MGGGGLILLDTHAWIWLRSDPARLPVRSMASIAGGSRLAVSSISFWEIATLVRLGRIKLDRGVDLWLTHALEAEPKVEAISVSPVIATYAGSLNGRFPGDPADRIIYTTANSLNFRLVTKDERIRAFAPGLTLWD